MVHVPILMYHYIGSVPKNDPNPGLRAGLTVSPEAFTQQMDYLAANGYHPIDMTTLRGYFAGGTLPAKPVVVTLDDGTADLYTQAYPVLQAHHFKAVAYIISGFINASGRVTSQQILEMESGGIEIAAHTWNHLDLTTLSADRVQFELVRCKQDLEKVVGHPVLDFAYPSGRFNPAVVNQVLQAGYQSAVTTDWGATHTVADKLTWTRIRVDGGEPLEQFIANLGPTDPIVTAQVVATPSPPTVHSAP
jgi:peptidoglycan/xylan/chitin deacetylase (PgdA/CDA1 family)